MIEEQVPNDDVATDLTQFGEEFVGERQPGAVDDAAPTLGIQPVGESSSNKCAFDSLNCGVEHDTVVLAKHELSGSTDRAENCHNS